MRAGFHDYQRGSKSLKSLALADSLHENEAYSKGPIPGDAHIEYLRA